MRGGAKVWHPHPIPIPLARERGSGGCGDVAAGGFLPSPLGRRAGDEGGGAKAWHPHPIPLPKGEGEYEVKNLYDLNLYDLALGRRDVPGG
jgi:hypothetical protein